MYNLFSNLWLGESITVVSVILLVCFVVIFQKAGRSWLWAIIPFINVAVLFQIAGKPWWWLFLLIIPLVNIVIAIIALHSLSKKFGFGLLFTIFGLLFFPFVGFVILALPGVQYKQ